MASLSFTHWLDGCADSKFAMFDYPPVKVSCTLTHFGEQFRIHNHHRVFTFPLITDCLPLKYSGFVSTTTTTSSCRHFRLIALCFCLPLVAFQFQASRLHFKKIAG